MKRILLFILFCAISEILWAQARNSKGDRTSVPDKVEETKRVSLGNDVTMELVYVPAGQFKMGSTPEEKAWATSRVGGAQPGTDRESYEGEAPRSMQVKDGFWMGRTEVTVGQ